MLLYIGDEKLLCTLKKKIFLSFKITLFFLSLHLSKTHNFLVTQKNKSISNAATGSKSFIAVMSDLIREITNYS
jgi:hypothetical protein